MTSGFINMNKHKQSKQLVKRKAKPCWDPKLLQVTPHPISDIVKVLQSKKTKKNFRFKFYKFRRQDGSVGTVLSTVGTVFSYFTQNVEDNQSEVGKELRRIIRPCSVRLSRLSVLITEGNVFTCFSQNVEDNRCEVSKDLKGMIRPCSVRLSHLSETELMNSSHLLVPSDSHKAGSISVSEHTHRQSRKKKNCKIKFKISK